jgi:hypothetical protein
MSRPQVNISQHFIQQQFIQAVNIQEIGVKKVFHTRPLPMPQQQSWERSQSLLQIRSSLNEENVTKDIEMPSTSKGRVSFQSTQKQSKFSSNLSRLSLKVLKIKLNIDAILLFFQLNKFRGLSLWIRSIGNFYISFRQIYPKISIGFYRFLTLF